MSLTQAIERMTQIQGSLIALQTGARPAPVSTAVAAPTATPALSGTAPSFANVLAQAQAPAPAGGTGGTPLTTGQTQFADRLATQTGLDPRVIRAWLAAEESGGAAQKRQAANNHDWLNIGYTDSATYGAADRIWADPIAAADATAAWLHGQDSIPGYGRASAGVQAILRTAGQPPEAQIAALQHSGWASSGYPDLPALYRQAG